MSRIAIPGILLLTSASAAAATGVSGAVRISPAHPGPQRVGESGSAPMPKARILVLDARGHVVARGITGADGRFSVFVPAGEYSVRVDVGAAVLPRCGTAQARVRDGEMADVEVECDSGMR